MYKAENAIQRLNLLIIFDMKYIRPPTFFFILDKRRSHVPPVFVKGLSTQR